MPTIDGMPNIVGLLAGDEEIVLAQAALGRNATPDQVAVRAQILAAIASGSFPERPDALGLHFTTQGAGDPLSVWFAPTINNLAGYGYTIQATGGATIYTRPTLSGGKGRVYEVEALVEQVSVGGGEAPAVRIGMRSLKSDFADTDGTPDAFALVSAAGAAASLTVHRARFGYTAAPGIVQIADAATAIWLRPAVQINRKADNSGGETNSIARIRRYTVRDVTAIVRAEDDAFALSLAL